MRRIDVWRGRLAAVIGLLYVTIASLWPLTATGAVQDDAGVRPGVAASIDRDPARFGPADVRIAGVIAEVATDVSATRDRRHRGRQLAAVAAIGSTPETRAMLLIAIGVFCASLTTPLMTTTVRAAVARRLATAPDERRPHPAAAA